MTETLKEQLQVAASLLADGISTARSLAVREAIHLIEKQAAELEALRKDAKRHRFVKSTQRCLEPEEYDAAIDAAMKGGKDNG